MWLCFHLEEILPGKTVGLSSVQTAGRCATHSNFKLWVKNISGTEPEVLKFSQREFRRNSTEEGDLDPNKSSFLRLESRSTYFSPVKLTEVWPFTWRTNWVTHLLKIPISLFFFFRTSRCSTSDRRGSGDSDGLLRNFTDFNKNDSDPFKFRLCVHKRKINRSVTVSLNRYLKNASLKKHSSDD